jgi:hypothetical protein
MPHSLVQAPSRLAGPLLTGQRSVTLCAGVTDHCRSCRLVSEAQLKFCLGSVAIVNAVMLLRRPATAAHPQPTCVT